jgi:molecular chaperone DnaK
VKAKDRATGREQSVRITASSLLNKDEVERMVKDAEQHAEEDRKLRSEVEARNEADALAFQAERTLKDLGDKVSAEDRAATERAMEAVREALKGSDIEAVRARARELSEILQRVATAAYQATPSEPPAGDGQEPPPEGQPEGEPAGAGTGAGDETVEGEYKEV